jgi:hypothetical protein
VTLLDLESIMLASDCKILLVTVGTVEVVVLFELLVAHFDAFMSSFSEFLHSSIMHKILTRKLKVHIMVEQVPYKFIQILVS